MDPLQRRYLYERHTPEQLADWGRRLTRFRFVRAQGGHAGDGDSLLVRLRGEPAASLAVVRALGARPRPRRATTLPPATVPGHPAVEQPGRSVIGVDPVFLWVRPDALDVSVSDPDDVWSVSEAAVAVAERLEPLLAPFADRVVDPPVDSWRCVAPATRPELFASP